MCKRHKMVVNNALRNLCFILFLLITLYYKFSSANCENLHNISLTVTSASKNIYEFESFNGCIKPEKFHDDIEELAVLDQNITSITNSSVYRMSELKKLSFIGCEFTEITPGAFTNLPNLLIFQARNGNLKIIHPEIFRQTPLLEQLNFKENDVNMIADFAFANLPSLKAIILSHNDLNYISSNWFSGSRNIEILDLSHNSLEKLEKSTFIETPRLKKIFLDHNDIQTIEDGTFVGFKEITHLGLSHNRLQEIDAKIFQEKILINRLSLSANFLNYLSLELFKQIRPREIVLEGNPWNCLCLDRINDWLVDINGTLKASESCTRTDIPRCVFSREASSHCVEQIDEDLSEKFLLALKLLIPQVDDSCARLD